MSDSQRLIEESRQRFQAFTEQALIGASAGFTLGQRAWVAEFSALLVEEVLKVDLSLVHAQAQQLEEARELFRVLQRQRDELQEQVDAQAQQIEALKKERDKWLDNFSRSEQFQSARWQPIETLTDYDMGAVMWTPVERLHTPPYLLTMKPEIRISTRRHWTWATYWQPLPAPPVASPPIADLPNEKESK